MKFSEYMCSRIGSAEIIPGGELTAGSFGSFDLVYTAGFFGIDDSGSLKIVQRFAGDMAPPQFEDPAAPNYVSVTASNGARLSYSYDVKNNIRPWGKTLYIKVVRGYLREGDRIVVRFGDTSRGSPGIRMQTFCEETFELKVLVDAIATYDYAELPDSPTIRIVPGDPVNWKAVLPTLCRVGQPFRLSLKAEDLWGNPCIWRNPYPPVTLKPNAPVKGLPQSISFKPGSQTAVIEDLRVEREADLVIEGYNPSGLMIAQSNPLRIVESAECLPFWGDLHGQSEETIGTNSIEDYFQFARNLAFLDVAAHQGNDFQITLEFWKRLQDVTAKLHEPGRFITFPGYEWSGNTALGGDHNVYYLKEGETIHRSSHALIHDLSDIHTDRHTSRELLQTLSPKDTFVYAHVGGRYADLSTDAGQPVLPAVEIHSAWGTFEWLLHDAFDQKMRVGVAANSDDHKGRPGASYPGASSFGTYGGLTCFLCRELTREAVFESLKLRRHYATTGTRLFLDVRLMDRKNANGPPLGIMGDVVETGRRRLDLHVSVLGAAPIERVDVLNGRDTIDTIKPFSENELGSRIRILWEGAEYRGRGRETVWDGFTELSGNTAGNFRVINFWTPEKEVHMQSGRRLDWRSMTTGGFSGFDLYLEKSFEGMLDIHTAVIDVSIEIAKITYNDTIFNAGGLGRKIRIFRLPDDNVEKSIDFTRSISLRRGRDNPIYIRVTQEDGHQAWSSPIYASLTGSPQA
jgi:hypothetical protein